MSEPKCPNCGGTRGMRLNPYTKSEAMISKCQRCGAYFCDDCGNGGCPKCGSTQSELLTIYEYDNWRPPR